MDTLKTATGRELKCDYFNPFPQENLLNIQIVDIPLSIAAEIFSDPKETSQLWCSGMYVAQYTKLKALFPYDRSIRVVLGKE